MTPDYSPRYYQQPSLNRKRQVIDNLLEDLHGQYFDMVERALAHSDMQQSRDIIDYVKTL